MTTRDELDAFYIDLARRRQRPTELHPHDTWPAETSAGFLRAFAVCVIVGAAFWLWLAKGVIGATVGA